MKSDAPRFALFPVSPENVPTKHRAIFSSSFAGLSSHHVQPASMPAMPQRHRHVDDDSLRLIDGPPGFWCSSSASLWVPREAFSCAS